MKAVIVDIDGTLAEKGDRNPFDYSSVDRDTVKEATKELVNALWKDRYKIIILSGREDSCFGMTRAWLDSNMILFDELHMRKAGDRRKDSIVKKELYETAIKGKYDVRFVIDDRDQVVEMWRKELGLACFQADCGNF